MTLGASQFELDAAANCPRCARTCGRLIDGDSLALPGLALALDTLDAQHSQRTPAELELRIAELAQQIAELAGRARRRARSTPRAPASSSSSRRCARSNTSSACSTNCSDIDAVGRRSVPPAWPS